MVPFLMEINFWLSLLEVVMFPFLNRITTSASEVLYTFTNLRASFFNVESFGKEALAPRKEEITAYRASTASKKAALEDDPAPWCPIFITSDLKLYPLDNNKDSVVDGRSPVSNRDLPPQVTRKTILHSL